MASSWTEPLLRNIGFDRKPSKPIKTRSQEISTALIAAEQRIGELLLAIPKQAGASNFSRDEEKLKTKGETIKEMGYGKNEAFDYQQMAKNPEIVQKVIEEALARGITKASPFQRP